MDTTHAVEHGLPLCGLFAKIPDSLPKGHFYVSAAIALIDFNLRDRINCPGCKDKVRKLMNTVFRPDVRKTVSR